MKYKAIIFDMDGTIIDTEKIWSVALQQVIQSRGIELSAEHNTQLHHATIGLGVHDTAHLLKKMLNLEENIESLVQEKTAIAKQLYTKHIQIMDGFETFHRKALARNLKVGIATNADNTTLNIALEQLNLKQFFGDHIYNIAHVNYVGKPHPAIYLHTAKQLAIDPEHCIAIEDSAHGVKAAKSAGMFCIGYNSSGIEAQTRHSDIVVNAYHEINLDAILEIISDDLPIF